jgi:amidase
LHQMKRRELLSWSALGLMAPAVFLGGCGGGDRGRPDVEQLDLGDVLDALESGRYSSEELVVAYQVRIARFEGAYNAFTYLNPNALREARVSDARRRAGLQMGRLEGVPVVIKESMDYVGAPSTMGWRPLSVATGGKDLYPRRNAVVVQRLINAGAIILGKTNIPAFSDDGTRASSSWAGPTLNAVDRRFAPGASSSGTATAVAGALGAAGVGEETGGSIQNPSAAQSLVGLKPTFGLIPTTGVVPLGGSTRDVVGPICRNVRDAAIMLDALVTDARLEPGPPTRSKAQSFAGGLSRDGLKGIRLGTYGPGWRGLVLSPDTAELYQGALAELERGGAVLVNDPFAGSGFADLALNEPYDYRGTESAAYDLNNYFKGLTGASSLAELKALVGTSPFDPDGPLFWYVEALPELAESLSHPEDRPPLQAFALLKAQYVKLFESVMNQHSLDALVFPHATQSLPLLDDGQFISETTVSALNIAGLPGLTVPAGRYPNKGAPFSLIFVGRHWSEHSLLAMGYAYEAATQHRIRATLTPERSQPKCGRVLSGEGLPIRAGC